MSVFTCYATRIRAEVLDIRDEINLIQITSDDLRMMKTIDDVQYVSEHMYQDTIGKNNFQSNTEMQGVSDSFDIIDNNIQPIDKLSDDETQTEENLDFPPMTSMPGKQVGSTRYIWAGYVYVRDGYTQSFRCSNREHYRCPGRAKIKNGKVKETKEHSHLRESYIIPVEQAKQKMLLRAQSERSLSLRTIYDEACKTEPLVSSHLALDMMLNKMKRARRARPLLSSKSYVKPVKKLDLNFDFTKDWLDIPSGQNKVAFCKICQKDIDPLTKVRVYDHYLSKMHKRAELERSQSIGMKLRPEKENYLKNHDKERPKETSGIPDSDKENTKDINVEEELQKDVEYVNAAKVSNKRKIDDNLLFREEVKRLKIGRSHLEYEDYDYRISTDVEAQAVSAIDPSETSNQTSKISVHLCDFHAGCTVSELRVSLHRLKDDVWLLMSETRTDECGKSEILLNGEDLAIGLYKLHLDTRSYYSLRNERCLYPYIEIVFDVQSTDELYHFPIQLSPIGYNVCGLLKP